MSKETIAALMTALVGSGTVQAAQNLISNGGFEKPVVAQGQGTDFAVGTNVGGWAVVGQPSGIEIVSGTYVTAAGDKMIAHSGAQYAGLGYSDGTGSGNGIAQTVNLTPGQSYTLKFGSEIYMTQAITAIHPPVLISY